MQIWYSTWKTLKTPPKIVRINKFSKVAEYKLNIQKSEVFLYTKSKLSGRCGKKAISFTIALKRIKCLRTNLTKEDEEQYTGNCNQTLMEETRDDTGKWKDISGSWVGRRKCYNVHTTYSNRKIPREYPTVLYHIQKLTQNGLQTLM